MKAKRMKCRLLLVLALLLAGVGMSANAADTARQVLDKAVAAMKNAHGISADFKLSQQGRTVSGKYRAKGARFSIVTSGAAAWYDGKTLVNWSAQTGEATKSTPSQFELRDTNPLLYLSAANDYNVAFAQSPNASVKTLALTPKKRGTGVKSIRIMLNSASLTPRWMNVDLANGGKVIIELSNLSLKASVTNADFIFPAKKYPKAKIVDLR